MAQRAGLKHVVTLKLIVILLSGTNLLSIYLEIVVFVFCYVCKALGVQTVAKVCNSKIENNNQSKKTTDALCSPIA
jgi:hypothetical protein